SLPAGSYYLTYTLDGPAGESPPAPESMPFSVSPGAIPRVTLPVPPPAGFTVRFYLTPANGNKGSEIRYPNPMQVDGVTYDLIMPPPPHTLPTGAPGVPVPNLGGLDGANLVSIAPTGFELDGTANTEVVLAAADGRSAANAQGVYLSVDGGQTW